MRTYTVREVADTIGVSVITLQRWDRKGLLVPHRSPSGRRLYTEEQLMQLAGRKGRTPHRKTVAYLRVSSQAQRPDLRHQRVVMEECCTASGVAIDV
jgi:putative resolvase